MQCQKFVEKYKIYRVSKKSAFLGSEKNFLGSENFFIKNDLSGDNFMRKIDCIQSIKALP